MYKKKRVVTSHNRTMYLSIKKIYSCQEGIYLKSILSLILFHEQSNLKAKLSTKCKVGLIKCYFFFTASMLTAHAIP